MNDEKMVTCYASETGIFDGEQVADLIIKGQKKSEDFTQVKFPSFFKLIDTRVVTEKSIQPFEVDQFYSSDKYGKLNRPYSFMHNRCHKTPEVVLNTIKRTFLHNDGKCSTTAKKVKWKKIQVSGSYIKYLSIKHGWKV